MIQLLKINQCFKREAVAQQQFDKRIVVKKVSLYRVKCNYYLDYRDFNTQISTPLFFLTKKAQKEKFPKEKRRCACGRERSLLKKLRKTFLKGDSAPTLNSPSRTHTPLSTSALRRTAAILQVSEYSHCRYPHGKLRKTARLSGNFGFLYFPCSGKRR